MRVSTFQFQDQALRAFAERQREIGLAQQQIATGERIQKSSDDPLGAAQTARFDEIIGRLSQYQRNIDAASSDVAVQDESLGEVVGLLQRVQEIIVGAQNGTLNTTDHRNYAVEVRSITEQVLAVANTTNGAGEYVFSGTRTGQPAFAKELGNIGYRGDQTSRELTVSSSIRIQTTMSGSHVFESISSGNGRFAVSAAQTNTGTALASQATVTDSTALVATSYSISFTSDTTFDVVDDGSGTNVLVNQVYNEGVAFSFEGLELSVSGTPAAGDVYTVEPSTRKSIFDVLEEVADALERGPDTASGYALLDQSLQSGLAEALGAIDRLGEVRAELGSRLVTLDIQREYNETAVLGFQEARVDVAAVDYPETISRLSNALQVLESAQQSYLSTQNLSLFRLLR